MNATSITRDSGPAEPSGPCPKQRSIYLPMRLFEALPKLATQIGLLLFR